jgi:drug/metabolite transporter (DMT)-like permease
MSNSKIKSDLILLVAAMIWGFAFVAQRVGMEYVGPFTFNGVRFLLGSLVLLPFLFCRKKKQLVIVNDKNIRKQIVAGSILTGLILFCGAALQQVGIQYTTAGKAGFITGLYVIFVPVVAIFFGQKTRIIVWIGVILSALGLYLLSITHGFHMATGDFLVFLCAICFTGHVLMIAWLSPKTDSLYLAVIQFSICAMINLVLAFIVEKVIWEKITEAFIPLLYGGVLSVGVAYTMQVVAQKKAHPAYASIIFSLEAVFAALGGWLILDEHLSLRALTGCAIMLSGMIIVQIKGGK